MGLGLLLIPALGGYLFVARFNATRDGLRRESGYHVVFWSAITGILLFGASQYLLLLLDLFLAPSNSMRNGGIHWKAAFPDDYSAAAALSVAIGWLLPWLLNPFTDRLKARRLTAQKAGDHIGLIVDEAFGTGQLIEVWLESGKTYVGAPVARTFVARGDQGDLLIVPVLSGYRDTATRQLKITADYASVLRHKLDQSDLKPSDFRVAIPMREVILARPYLPAYDEWVAEQQRRQPPAFDVERAPGATGQ